MKANDGTICDGGRGPLIQRTTAAAQPALLGWERQMGAKIPEIHLFKLTLFLAPLSRREKGERKQRKKINFNYTIHLLNFAL